MPAHDDPRTILMPENLPVDRQIPDGMLFTYSNHTSVQALGGDLLLDFYQAANPLAATQAEADRIECIPARCVVRIALNQLQARDLASEIEDLLVTLRGLKP